jgi:2-polyprenyl-3-methyl-5-hydroxy-6-metoxy-1,4-benzoquinol methylase
MSKKLRARKVTSSERAPHVERFDEVAKRHLEDLNQNLRWAGGDSRPFYLAKINMIRDRVPVPPKVILDYGCGIGTLTKMLADLYPHAKVVGFDPSAEGIKIARETYAKEAERLAFESALDWGGVRADLVVAAGVFHHIPREDKLSCMRQVSQSMTSKGRVFVFEHNPISPITRLIVSRAAVDRGATLIYPWHMRRMMRDCGFTSIDLEFISFVPPSLKRLLWVEPYLTRIPISAQYLASGQAHA